MGLFPLKTFDLGTPVWSSKCQKQLIGYALHSDVARGGPGQESACPIPTGKAISLCKFIFVESAPHLMELPQLYATTYIGLIPQ